MKITGQESAYPTMDSNGERHPELHSPGLTIRQQFAMAAMQGMCADTGTANMTHIDLAKHAVNYADAMIAELNRAEE